MMMCDVLIIRSSWKT